MLQMRVLTCCVKVSKRFLTLLSSLVMCLGWFSYSICFFLLFLYWPISERISATVLGVDITWVILIAVSTVLIICASFVATTIYLCRKTNNYSNNRTQCKWFFFCCFCWNIALSLLYNTFILFKFSSGHRERPG